ncbi:formylglycine-generating enzyme family protein [Myxococcota bacterium]|nr:formylglycine-generating enzyme family protein [Myxococcota bacterium]MBU1897457.1 formylglycine-generating enzyme family protein [Myxococcota bacterium]
MILLLTLMLVAPPTVTPPDAAALVRKAERQLYTFKLTEPAHDCVYATLQALEALEPKHPAIPRLKRGAVRLYRIWAQEAISQARWPKAGDLLTRGLKVDPSAADLQAMLKEVKPKLKAAPPPAASTEGMAYIPAGLFYMGSDALPPDRKPKHKIHLDAFFIDRTEVSNLDFVQFLNKHGDGGGRYWKPGGAITQGERYSVSAAYADYPAHFVSFFGAEAYCRAQLKRLPTEAEWEKAARGVDGRQFPWGDAEPTAARINLTQARGWEAVLQPSGSYTAGDSPFGLSDVAGQVWEWCADWYDPKLYAWDHGSNPKGPKEGAHRVLKGGQFGPRPLQMEPSYRNHQPPQAMGPFTGFRCALTPTEAHWTPGQGG